jgi:hypothetical protein
MLNGTQMVAVVKDAASCRQFVELMFDEKRHVMMQCIRGDLPSYVPPPKRRPW